MRRSLLDAVASASGNAWVTVLGTVAAFVARVLVVPEAFGATNFAQGIMGYFGAYNGIFRNAIGQEIPTHVALRQREEATAVLNAAYSMLLGSLLLQTVALLIFASLTGDVWLKLAAFTGAFLNIVDSISTQDRVLLQATRRFLPLTMGHLVAGFLSPASLLLCAWLAGARGYFLGLALGGAIRFAVYRALLGPNLSYFTRRLNMDTVKQVLATGIGISLLTLAGQLLLTVDRWVILRGLGTRELGFYSLGSSVIMSLVLIPVSIAGSHFPSMVGSMALGNFHQVAQGTRRVQATVSLLSVLMLGFLALIIGPAVQRFLPSYGPAISALQIMPVWGYFYSTIMVASQVHVAARQVPRAIGITAAYAGVGLALSLFLVRYGLVGVAAAMSLAWAMYALAFNWSASLLTKDRGLMTYMLAGGGMLAGLIAVLLLRGFVAAWVCLVAVGCGVVWYLTRLLGINWRTLPASAKAYLFAGSRG